MSSVVTIMNHFMNLYDSSPFAKAFACFAGSTEYATNARADNSQGAGEPGFAEWPHPSAWEPVVDSFCNVYLQIAYMIAVDCMYSKYSYMYMLSSIGHINYCIYFIFIRFTAFMSVYFALGWYTNPNLRALVACDWLAIFNRNSVIVSPNLERTF